MSTAADKILSDIKDLKAHFSAGLQKAERLEKRLENSAKRKKKDVVSDEELARLDARMEKNIQKKLKH